MSLIVDATISGSTRRMAMYDIMDRTYPYFNELLEFSDVKVSAPTRHGGYVKPVYGSAELLATAFDGAVPPASITFPAKLITSAGDVVLLDAAGQLGELLESSVVYNLYGQEGFDETTTDDTDTSISSFVYLAVADMAAVDMSYFPDSQYISFTLSEARPIFDVLNEMCQYGCIGFWVELGYYNDAWQNVLYVRSYTSAHYDTYALDKYDFFDSEVEYQAPTPYSRFEGGDYFIAGSYSHGSVFTMPFIYHTTQSEIEARLAEVKAIMDKWWITIKLPIGDNVIKWGDHITFTDDSKFVSIDVDMRAREFVYSLSAGQEYMTISGEGDISATT